MVKRGRSSVSTVKYRVGTDHIRRRQERLKRADMVNKYFHDSLVDIFCTNFQVQTPGSDQWNLCPGKDHDDILMKLRLIYHWFMARKVWSLTDSQIQTKTIRIMSMFHPEIYDQMKNYN